jgi:uncharacterized protein YjbJ (UPF0337 family)
MKSDMVNRIQTKWGKFSKPKLLVMKDDLSELVGMIQRVYGYSKDRAEREFHDFQLSLRPVLHPVVTKPEVGR